MFVFSAVFLILGCNSISAPSFHLAGNNIGEFVENEKNCQVINSLLLSEWGQDLYIHGWETEGDADMGYIVFIAGFEPYPQKEWLALAWKVENNKATLLPDPSEGVEYLKNLMEKDRSQAGPAGPMEKYQKWDMCKLKNMDYYHGKTNAFSAAFNMKESIRNWNESIQLPYRSMIDYFQEKINGAQN